MKLGVFTVLLGNKSLDEALKYLKESGVQAVELGPVVTRELPMPNLMNCWPMKAS